MNEYIKNNATKPVNLDELIASFKNKPFDFSPGTEYRYSNSGYVLLGYIIEKITGKSYFTVVNENIFKPLKMTHSGFDFSNLKSANKATGYFKLSEKSQNLLQLLIHRNLMQLVQFIQLLAICTNGTAHYIPIQLFTIHHCKKPSLPINQIMDMDG